MGRYPGNLLCLAGFHSWREVHRNEVMRTIGRVRVFYACRRGDCGRLRGRWERPWERR